MALLVGGFVAVPATVWAEHGAGLTHDEAAFRGALGPHTVEAFEGFAAGTFITDQVSGVTFSTPGEPLYVFSGSGGKVLFGGFQRNFAPERPQVFQAVFSTPATGVGFRFGAQDPASTPATFRAFLTDGTTQDFSISDDDGNESTGQYLGFRPSSGRITAVHLLSGFEHASGLSEEVTIDDFAFAAPPMPAPAVDAIHFAAAVDGDQEILVTDELGRVPTRLTDSPGLDSDPNVSPDGTKVLFVSDRAGSPDIWMMDADGTDPVNLTPDPADQFFYDADPEWSPDGTQVAFASERSGGFEIYTMPATPGATATRVTFGNTFFGGGFPAWSPDGGRIAYRTNRTTDMEVFEVELATGTERNLTNRPGSSENTPAYSPDGSSIAYISGPSEAEYDVWLMAADGSSQRPLVAKPGQQTFPAWSPEGDRIVFDSGTTSADHDLEVVDLASGAITPLTTDGADNHAADWAGAADARGLGLTVSQASTLPGASTIDPQAIPVSELPLALQGDVADTPLRSVDIADSPLRSVPLRSVPLRSVPLRSVPLRSVTLSDIPLRSVAFTWADVLASTPLRSVPLQNITLDEVLALDPPLLAQISLDDLDLASTPLRSVSMVSLAMGAIPLRSVPVPGASNDAFTNWCALLDGLGYSCAELALTPDSPILAVDIAGVPLRSVPLRSVPLRSVPLRSVDLVAAGLTVEAAPLRSVPLRSVPLRSVELGALPLRSVSPAVLAQVIDCSTYTCRDSDTLADAEEAGAIAAGATLGQLFDGISDWDDVPGSLLDLLQGLIRTTDYPWESLPVSTMGIQDFAPVGAPVLTYTATFQVNPGAGSAGGAAVELPEGFRYVAGSTSAPLAEPVQDGRSLRWPLTGLTADEVVSWTFEARPGLTLDDAATSALTVDLGRTPKTVRALAPVSVYEDFESFPTETSICVSCGNFEIVDGVAAGQGFNDTPSGAALIDANTLVLSHIGRAGDVDYYKLPIPEKGTRLQVRLGNESPDADFDVALLNGAAAAPLRSVPLRSVPLRSVPLRSVPIPDNGLTAEAADDFLSTETLDDIPTNVVDAPLRSVSQNRSGADELIDTTSNVEPASADYYLIQVTAYNGGSSAAPYVLYVKQFSPPPPPPCAPRPTIDYGAGVDPSPTVPPGTETLILTSPSRLRAFHAADTSTAPALSPADQAVADLRRLAGATNGFVYEIEQDPAVRAALAAWDQTPCDPVAANAVVAAVGNIIDGALGTDTAEPPALKHVVLAGADDIVPMARVADYTQMSNEASYAADAIGADGLANPLSAAFFTQNILSDDPYGDLNPTAWLDHHLYVPEIAVGRLVETPADLSAQVEQFIGSRGLLDPATAALTTGYDFLTDGAGAVQDSLLRAQPAAVPTPGLINDTWTRQNVVDALFPPAVDANTPAPAAPGIANVNAHYDHRRSLPADGNARHDETDLFTVGDVTDQAAEALARRILFTMGCHAGLSVPDGYFGSDRAAAEDWAQTYLGAGQKAAVYFANTGFGYGDTEAVALSERLMALFAERLDGSMTVGQAAIFAKQAYFGTLGAYGPYDEKALQEATFYGLPMYRIGTPKAAPAPPTVTPEPSSTGVASVGVVATSTFTPSAAPDAPRYFEVSGGAVVVDDAAPDPVSREIEVGQVQVTQYRPIVPKTSTVVTSSDSGQAAKGFVIRGLTSEDQATTPAVARPVVDLSANEPAPPAGDVAFPASLSNITTSEGPAGPEQRLVLLPGQVFRDAGVATDASVQRLFTHIAGDVVYGPAGEGSDQTAPFLTNVSANVTNGELTLSADVSDLSGVDEVVALFHDVESGSTEWVPVTLAETGEPGRYVGRYGDAEEPVGATIEYFIQGVDAAGNVGTTTNKGRYYSPRLHLSTDPLPPTTNDGYHTGPVAAVVAGRPLTSYRISIDGNTPSRYDGPTPIAGDGDHVVRATGDDGSAASLTVKVDRTAPTVTVTGVEGGRHYTTAPAPACTASDATSGLAGPCAVTTATSGSSTTATATATDRAGNVRSATVTYTVGSAPQYSLEGTFSPVDRGIQNVMKPGAAVPVKFRLLDKGAVLTDPAAVVKITSAQITCGSQIPQDVVEQTVTAGSSSLRFDSTANHFVYTWKTDKQWASQCRVLRLTFADRSTLDLLFKFTK